MRAAAMEGLLSRRWQPEERLEIINVTDRYGVLVLAGPRSRDLLASLTDCDLSNASFRWLTGKEIMIAGIPLRGLRVNYVGELGWELHAPMSRLAELYDLLRRSGLRHGISDFGLYAVNSMRMEKAIGPGVWSSRMKSRRSRRT